MSTGWLVTSLLTSYWHSVAAQDSSPVARDRALSALVSVGPLYQVDRVLHIVLGKSTRPQVRMWC